MKEQRIHTPTKEHIDEQQLGLMDDGAIENYIVEKVSKTWGVWRVE